MNDELKDSCFYFIVHRSYFIVFPPHLSLLLSRC